MTERKGYWLHTYLGHRFWVLDPRPEDLHVEDIAHALALQCRWNGHVSSFYSIAQHCVLMSQHVPEEDALWALLHDAPEAYLGDVVRPLKVAMPIYNAIETKVMTAVCERYGLAPDMPKSVHEADNRILENERIRLKPDLADDWRPMTKRMEPLPFELEPWSWQRAKEEYLQRFRALCSDFE